MVSTYTLQIMALAVATLSLRTKGEVAHPGLSGLAGNKVDGDIWAGSTVEEMDSLIVEDLEKYVDTLAIKNLDGGALLIQYLDYLNQVATFRQLDKERGPFSIYDIRLIPNVTKGKDSFVLRHGQDLIRVFNTKRQFVGLRRAGFQDRALFFVFYIYLKDAVPGDQHKKTIGGKQYTLEIDTWDHRGGLEHRSTLFGWTTCNDSIFIPCKSSESNEFPIAEIKSQRNPSTTQKPPPGGYLTSVPTFVTQPGLNQNSEIDYFYDLDPSPSTALYMRDKIDLLTRQAARSKSSSAQGRSIPTEGSKSKGKIPPGQGRLVITNIIVGITGGIVGTLKNAALGSYAWGMGFIKSFRGLFGGLGTSSATVAGVLGNTIDEDVSEPGWLDDKEMAALIAEVQGSSAGGLGGLINPDESDKEAKVSEKDFEETTLFKVSKGLESVVKKIGRSFQASGGDAELLDKMPMELVDRIVENSLTLEVDTFIHPGWKTLWKAKLSNKVTLSHEEDPFVGMGPCPYLKVTSQSLLEATSTSEVLYVYMSALRTQCINVTLSRLSMLVKEGYLIIQPDNSIVLRGDLKDLTEEILTIPSLEKLGQALEFAAFTKVLKKELQGPSPSARKSPDGSEISRSVFTLGLVVQEGLEMILKMARAHSVRLRRNVVKSLQTFFVKLVQDGMILRDCEDCKADKAINHNDQLYVIGLYQFIFKGLGIGAKLKELDISRALTFFLKNNRASLEVKLKMFQL